MKTLTYLSLLTLALTFSSAYAVTPPANPQELAQSGQPLTIAVVKKIDSENKKITLAHETIKNLDMPAMTMVFKIKLKDPAVLETLKPGDKVKAFLTYEKGVYEVQELSKVK